MLWSYLLASIGILGIYLAGRKSKWGWAVGLFAQTLWIAFALVTKQYGFIISAVAYGLIYAKNFVSWAELRDDGCSEEK